MEAKGNILIANLDDKERESVSVSFFVKDVGDEELAKTLIRKFGQIAKAEGADVATKSIKI